MVQYYQWRKLDVYFSHLDPDAKKPQHLVHRKQKAKSSIWRYSGLEKDGRIVKVTES